MELWVVLAIAAAVLMALGVFFDNYIADVFFKDRLPQSRKIFSGPGYLIAAIIVAIIFGLQAISVGNALWLVAAGMLFGVSLIPYYIALSKDESTNVAIVEQLSPIFYLMWGWWLLHSEVSFLHLVAIAVLMAAPALIVLSSRKRSQGNKIKMIGLMLIKITLGTLANTLIVELAPTIDFITMMFYVMIGRGLVDVALAVKFKAWRRRFKIVMYRGGFKAWLAIATNFVIWLGHEFVNYSALIIAPAMAMSSAITKTLMPISVFMFGLAFTIIWPSFGREKLDRKTVTVHLIAVVLAVIGIILMQTA
ncbi:EamA family transporter [Candidatus Saccharibacteria bacterium]|nr:EamA family transporter [Candidatus Saccharibacteria bacterium]